MYFLKKMLSVLSRRCLCGIKRIHKIKHFACSVRNCSDKKDGPKNNIEDVLGLISKKYQVFREEDSSPVLDINDEKFHLSTINPDEDELEDYYKGLNLNRGVTGVYEIGDLLAVLKRESALDIFVASVSPDLKYVDYICVVSGKSYRHMIAIAQFVRKIYKIKRNPKDILPKIEGENSKEWIALDLGNIALHIFSQEARIKYDLESLWSVGEEFDDESNKPDDPLVEMLKKHSVYLGDLEPDNSKT